MGVCSESGEFRLANRVGPPKVVAPVVRMGKLVSLAVHLASAAGDPHALAAGIVYIFMLILTRRSADH